MAVLVKTINGLAYASVKTRNGLATSSLKTINGLDVTSGGGESLFYATGETLTFDEYLGYIFPNVATAFISPANGNIVRVEPLLINDSGSILDFSAQLYSDTNADDLPDTAIGTAGTFNSASVPSTYGYFSISLTATLALGTKYWLNIAQTTPGFGDPYIRWMLGTVNPSPLSHCYLASGGLTPPASSDRYGGSFRPQFKLYSSP